MRTESFDYTLPASAIAQYPRPRGESRLLHLAARGAPEHRRIADLPDLLEPGDLLVVNDTRVLRARLLARRATGGKVEVLVVRPRGETVWEVMLRPGRRIAKGDRLELEDGQRAEVLDHVAGRFWLRFPGNVEAILERLGSLPLPPYIRRTEEALDRERYQTVFAHAPGAIAAPTAGLHLTTEILSRLEARGIERVAVTLHVGPGTFRPVVAASPDEHEMEAERFEVGQPAADAIAAARRSGRRVVAVGTTVVRTLETFVATARDGDLAAAAGETRLFITPGYEFQAVDVLLTNFHLPRSTLLMLVSAFAGTDRILGAYREALERGYLFYSYGDAMLIERSVPAPGDEAGGPPPTPRDEAGGADSLKRVGRESPRSPRRGGA